MSSISVKTKMIVVVTLLTTVLLSILAFSAHVFFVDQIKQMVASQQFTLVSAIADQIDDKLETARTELVATAGTLTTDIIDDPARMQSFFSGRPDTSSMFDNGLYLFSAQGELLAGATAEPDMIGRNFSGRDYLASTLRSRRAQISEPFFSAQSHRHPIVMFTAPIFNSKGEIHAILTGSIDLLKENFLGKLATIKLGKGGYLYLFNSSRTILMHPDRKRILANDVPPGANVLFDKALAGFEGTGETVNSRKVAVISSFRRLKSTGWILAGNFPQSEAYLPVYRAQHYLWMSLSSMFLMSLVIIWLFMKQLTAPLLSFTTQIRELTDRTSSRTRVRIESKDEIGALGEAFNLLLDELEERKGELQKQFDFSQMLIDTIPNPIFFKDSDGRYLGCNAAFEKWTGFSRQQLIGKTVFQIAPPDLAAIYHQADLDILREKKRLQVYETSAVAADGSMRQVVFSKAVFPTPEGTPGGMIGTMVDITDRKRAESELAVQKEFAESLVQNSAVPTFVMDHQHRLLFWNRACEALTGVKGADVIGTDQGWQVFFQDKRPLLAELLIDGNLEAISRYYHSYALSTLIPEGVQAEGSYLDRFGELHYLAINAAPIRDNQGKLVAVIQTLEDITARKRAEEAHEKTRRQLQLILDAAGEGIYGVDRQGRVTFANPAALQMVGWSQQELLGAEQHAALHHTRADGTPNPIDGPVYLTLQDSLTRVVSDDLFWRKSGSSFPVEYICTPLVENEELLGAVVIFKDTTERLLAEEQLLKLSQAVMQSPVSIVITDPKGDIEFVNPMFTQMTGYEAAEVIGRNPRLLRTENTPPELYKDLWNTIASGRVWTGELYNRQKSGDLAWVHATISPIRNSSGVISHFMSFMESMTERKRLEEQLRQAQKMEAVGQLAGGISHDFNNILTVIMGFGQLLNNTLPGNDPRRGHMDQILGAADRAAHLTQSLLAFSRKQVMMLQQVELNELTRKHISFLNRIIGEDVTLQVTLTADPLMVLADSGQIEQVLMNLATNARDAMPGGGELHISTRAVQLDREFHRQHGYGVSGHYALISMRDTGCGIPADVSEKIFEPFYTTKAPGRGTGLGLSIVYGIVKQHGGYITIDSKWGVGTSFSVYIPLSDKHKVPKEQPVLVVPTGGSETILVVEDDPAVRKLVESVLTTFGYAVILAEDGLGALDLFKANMESIDLALVDLIMPRMNGKQLCEEMKRLCPQLKVLFQSGYTADLLEDRGVLVDGVDLIMKPVQPVELARKVREMLDLGKAPEALISGYSN